MENHVASTSAHRSEFLVADGVVVARKAGQKHRHLTHAREEAAWLLLAPGVIATLTAADGFIRTNWATVILDSGGRSLRTLKTASRELPKLCGGKVIQCRSLSKCSKKPFPGGHDW